MIVEQQPPQLLILGSPPGSSSSPTAGGQLPDDQAAAWLSNLAASKARLDASIAALLLASGQLDAVRSDLGMPQVDPTPPPEAGAASSPILAYGANFAWTADAQNAQAKLVQTALFASGVMQDALDGKRALYWNNGDLFIGALDGDPYGVLMRPSGGAGSALIPDYVDLSSGNTTGQVGFGIAPILIGLGIGAVVVLSIASAFAVTKITEYLAGAHRDDAMGKVASAQQSLVAAGQQTPEQAAAFMRASADLVSAPPPGAPQGLGLGAILAAAAIGIVAGVVGAEVVPKILATRLTLGAPATA